MATDAVIIKTAQGIIDRTKVKKYGRKPCATVSRQYGTGKYIVSLWVAFSEPEKGGGIGSMGVHSALDIVYKTKYAADNMMKKINALKPKKTIKKRAIKKK